jgi:hypothetical protein
MEKTPMTKVVLNIGIGNETQSIELTRKEWSNVQVGQALLKNSLGFYEGEEINYIWCFNDPRFLDTSLVVLYDEGEGFIGSIQDAWFS